MITVAAPLAEACVTVYGTRDVFKSHENQDKRLANTEIESVRDFIQYGKE